MGSYMSRIPSDIKPYREPMRFCRIICGPIICDTFKYRVVYWLYPVHTLILLCTCAGHAPPQGQDIVNWRVSKPTFFSSSRLETNFIFYVESQNQLFLMLKGACFFLSLFYRWTQVFRTLHVSKPTFFLSARLETNFFFSGTSRNQLFHIPKLSFHIALGL